MTSNNAVILPIGEAHLVGPVIKGKTLVFEKRPYAFPELKEGEFIVQTLYLSSDPYLVLRDVADETNCRAGESARRFGAKFVCD
jgi:NADPH-dependent curcumin reductase CurA